MYVYSGYLNHGDMELEDYTHPLIVTGCGIYRLIRQPIMHTIRTEGRKDYQLLYISSGKAFFEFPEGSIEVSVGEMILYRPGVPQRYWYLAEDRPEVCWIHFTGSQAESYLNEAGFSKKHQLHVGIFPEYRELFRQIIGELQLRRPCFEEFPPHYLRLLFAEIHRSQKEGTLSLRPNQEEILRAVQDFNESFAAPISIQEYCLPSYERLLVYPQLPKLHGNGANAVYHLPAYHPGQRVASKHGLSDSGDRFYRRI